MPRGRPKVDAFQRARAKALQSALTARRQELDLSVEEISRRSGVNRRTLDKYFEGESPSPSFFLIDAISRVVGLGLDELAGREGIDD